MNDIKISNMNEYVNVYSLALALIKEKQKINGVHNEAKGIRYGIDVAMNIIDKLPKICDGDLRVATWIKMKNKDEHICSNCSKSANTDKGEYLSPFCPRCGYLMSNNTN